MFSISTTVKTTADIPEGEARGFVASPSSVVFIDYLPGQTYNVSYHAYKQVVFMEQPKHPNM